MLCNTAKFDSPQIMNQFNFLKPETQQRKKNCLYAAEEAVLIHKQEFEFLEKVHEAYCKIRYINLNRYHLTKLLNKSVAVFSRWRIENKTFDPLPDCFTSLDLIYLSSIPRYIVPYKLFNRIAEQDLRRDTKQLSSRLCGVYSSDALPSIALSALFLMKVKKFVMAIQLLNRAVVFYNKEMQNTTFRICNLITETGYTWIFNRATMNALQEQCNVYRSTTEAMVSAKLFFSFLLSKCHRSLGNEKQLVLQVKNMNEQFNIKCNCNGSSTLYFDHVLFNEVVEMTAKSSVSPNTKLAILAIIKHAETYIASKNEKKLEERRHFGTQFSSDDSGVEEFFKVISDMIVSILDACPNTDSVDRQLRQVTQSVRGDFHRDDSSSERAHLMRSAMNVMKDLFDDGFNVIHAMLSNDTELNRAIADINTRVLFRLDIQQCTRMFNDCHPHFRKHFLELSLRFLSDSEYMEHVLNKIYSKQITTPAIRIDTILCKSVPIVLKQLKIQPNVHESYDCKSLDERRFPIMPVLQISDVDEVSNLHETCMQQLFKTLNKLADEYRRGHFSGHPVLGQILWHHSVLNNDEITDRFVEYIMNRSASRTTSDIIYFCQKKIHRKLFSQVSATLEYVVTKESNNPLSIVIWPKDLERFVDENVKLEINKSPSKCIVVPSVVYALYLLATIHRSHFNVEAYEKTMTRFKKIRDFLAPDSPISDTLFEYARQWDKTTLQCWAKYIDKVL